MAIGNLVRANSAKSGSPTFQPIGSYGGVVLAIDNASATAATTAEQINPASVTGTSWHWIKRGEGMTRAYIYARMLKSTTVVTTSPVIKVYGAYPVGSAPTLPDNNSGAIPTDGTWVCKRLDAATAAAGGQTLTLALDAADTQPEDTTYIYSDETSVIDLQDAPYVLVLHSTAASITNGTSTVVEVYARGIS